MGDMFSIPEGQDTAVTMQLRGLVDKVNQLQDQIAGLSVTTQAVARSISAGSIINFLRNADINTSDAGRRGFTYTTPDNAADVCAFFYAPGSADAGPFTDSVAATESPEAIASVVYVTDGSITATDTTLTVVTALFTAAMVGREVYVSGAGAAGVPLITTIASYTSATEVELTAPAVTTVAGDATVLVYDVGADTVWDNAGGVIWYGGPFTLITPLQKNYCRPGVGNDIFIVFNVRLNAVVAAESITSDYQMRLSIWDNTTGQQKIIEGAAIPVEATLVRGSGAVVRQYVVRYYNASGDTFLSSVSSAVSVAGTPSPVAVDPGQVSVVFPMYPTVQSVQVFRSDSEFGLNDYYLIDTVSTGIDNIQDNGGRAGAAFTFTDDFWKADALLLNIGPLITNGWSSFSFHILCPATYDLALTDPNSQWLRLDVLDVDGNIIDIPPMALQLDFFGLSYRPGTWQPSASDQEAAGDFESNSPSPSGGIPTGPPDDPGGGGRGRDPFNGFLPF